MQKINIASLPEGMDAQFVITKFKETNNDLLFISRDDRRLEDFRSALLFFAPELDIIIIPSWDCSPYEPISPNPQIVSQRLNSLVRIINSSKTKNIYLTTINAATQFFPPKEVIDHSYFKIEVGKYIDDQLLIKRLYEFGYIRTSLVTEPGEFAVRGGIIDIYSSGVEGAIRLDLFGDTVDKIRNFDVKTQLTTRQLGKFELFPISEIILNDTTVSQFRQNFRKEFGTHGNKNHLYLSISDKRKVQGIEQWLPLFYNNLESIFDYLPTAEYFLDQNIKNNHSVRWENINEQFHVRTSNFSKNTEDTGLGWCVPGALFIDPEKFDKFLDDKSVYHFTTHSLPSDNNTLDAKGKLGPKFFLERQQDDVFLFDAVNNYIKREKGSRFVILAAGSEGSRDRLYELLKEEDSNNLIRINSFKDIDQNGHNNQLFLAVWPIDEGFSSDKIIVISENDIFGKKLYKSSKRAKRSKNIITDALSLEVGDAVIHIDHGIGRFQGFETILSNGNRHECLLIEYAERSKLFLPVENIELLSRHNQGLVILDKLGGSSWQKRKSKLKKQILEMADKLIETAALRKLKRVMPLELPEEAWNQFCSTFNYMETDDQIEAVEAIIEDFRSGIPMDRLICGDVGFGKTEIAMRAAFIAAMSGIQVAVICPTTLLARQHYSSFSSRFSGFPIRIEQLSRLVPLSKCKKTKNDLANGKIDILIGTHSVLSDKITFSNLGFLIIDEEQHFGVAHKEKLKNIRNDIHVLTLTATPIPRTLNMSLSGLKDLSIINTPPIDRLSIRTYVLEFDVSTIRQALLREFYRGGQSFIVVPRIKDIARLEEFLMQDVPEISYIVAHAKLPSVELDQRMNDFYDKKYNILLATTIIESGLDISSANTIIIHHADRFGLSQLYQLRGRVGRSKLRAYAYLTTKSNRKISFNASKRLKVISSLTDLGVGFNLASQDLDLRGSGNILGDAQSGHIREIGFELYHSLLDETIQKLKDGFSKSNFEYSSEWTPKLNLGMSILIPEEYIPDDNVRLDLYKRLSRLSTKMELEGFASQLIDRFGPIPKEINTLLSLVQIKALCTKIGISQIDVITNKIILELREDNFLNTAKLITYLNDNNFEVRVKKSKLIFNKNWKTNREKVRVIFSIFKDLRKLCDNW